MLFITAVTVFPKTVTADEPDNRSLKLGYYEYAGFFDFHDNGKGDGYINKYTDLIENYSNYDFNYQQYQYKEDIKALLNGSIDLVCYPEQILDEYEGLYTGTNTIAKECGVLYISEENTTINYEDFTNMNGIKIAIINDDSIYEDLLKNYAKNNRFTYSPIYYDDITNAVNAVKRGDVDCVLSGSLRNISELEKVSAFGSVEYKFASTLANREIINNIDYYINELQLSNNDFDSDIYQSVYRNSGFNKVVLTTEEKDYIARKKVLNVAYACDIYPLGYTNNKGDFCGYYSNVAEYIEKATGIEFNFVEYPNINECIKAVQNKECDTIIGISSEYKNTLNCPLRISESFLEMSLIKIAKNESDFLDYTSYTTSDYVYSLCPIEEEFRNDTLEISNSIEDSIDSVVDGDNNFAVVPEYVWFSYVKDEKYSDVEVNNIEGYSLELGFGIPKDTDSIICYNILNKAITGMNAQCPSQIIFDISHRSLSDDSLVAKLKQNKQYIAFIIIIIIVSGLSYYIVRKKNDKQLLLSDIAYTDSITGYSNYNKFIIDANKKLKFRDVKYAVGYLDVNNFKSINDYYGRLAGNKVLLSLSEKISDLVNPNGIFSRIFADRFVFLVDYLDISTLEYTIKTYLTQTDVYLDEKKDAIKITCSCGIYLVKEDEVNIYNMIDKAQMSVKMAKQSLKKNVSIFDDKTNAQLIKNQKLTSNMDKALEKHEFTVYMQPKYDIATEKIYGAEALVRWNSSEYGFISPIDFIPLFEKNGFVTQVDFYVLEEVCKYLRNRMDNGLKVVPVAVNQSRLHVLDTMYISKIEDLLDKYNINSNMIIFELTESAFTENPDEMVALIKRMNNLGYIISMDDFGSGYSSLNMLKELPLTEIKVDKEFLSGTSNFEKTRYIVKTLVEMAHGLRLKVVCEGVETAEHLEFLKEIECDIAQGYYFSKPVSMEEFSKLL